MSLLVLLSKFKCYYCTDREQIKKIIIALNFKYISYIPLHCRFFNIIHDSNDAFISAS